MRFGGIVYTYSVASCNDDGHGLGIDTDSGVFSVLGCLLQDLLSGHILAYAEHELGEHFSDYLGFIRARNPVPERRAASILREFALNWRTGVAHIRENTIRVFPSFKNGQRVCVACK